MPSLVFFLHDTEASTYGVLSGASEVFLGEALGALAKGGSKFLSKKLEGTVIGAIKNNASKAINEILESSQTASAVAAIIKNMGKEAAEEYFQYALDPLMQNISFDGTDYTAKEIIENAFSPDAIHAAWLGALSSGTSQMTGLAANGVASKLTGKGGLLSEQNLNKLTESEAKEINDALTNAYAGMLENEGYRNVEAYRKQAEKTNANKATANAHALAVGAELAQMIETQTQKAEKEAGSKNVAKAVTASQNEESANRNGKKTAVAAQAQTESITTFSEEKLKSMSVSQLKSILQSLAPAFAEKWKSAGLKAAEVDRQVAEMLGGKDVSSLAESVDMMQRELGAGGNGDILNQSVEAETQPRQNPAEMLKGEENGGRIKAEEGDVYSEEEKALYEKEAEPLFPMRSVDKTKDAQTVSRAKEIRTDLPSRLKRSGNLGYAQVDIEGLGQQEYYAHSRIDQDNYSESIKQKHPNIVINPVKPIFEAIEVGPNNIIGEDESYSRTSDTEYKILNQIAEQLGDRYDAQGAITLFTERRPCPSCARNINQFQQKYPNIKIFIVHNEGVNILKEK